LAPNPVLGNALALASGVSWALTIFGLRWLDRREPELGGTRAVLAGNLIAFFGCLPFALPVENAGLADVWVILYLGVFQIALAYWFLTRAVRSVPALEASLLLLIEPVLNPIWAFLIHRESPGMWSIAGGVVILGATLVRTGVDFVKTSKRRGWEG